MRGGEVEPLLGTPSDQIEQQRIADACRERSIGERECARHVGGVQRRFDRATGRRVEPSHRPLYAAPALCHKSRIPGVKD